MLHERDELMQQHHRNPAGTTEKMARQQQQLENKLKSKTEEIQVIMSQKRELQRTVEGLRSTSTRISRLTDEIQEMKQQRVSLQRSVEQAQRQHKQELEEKRKEIQQLQRQTRQQTRQIPRAPLRITRFLRPHLTASASDNRGGSPYHTRRTVASCPRRRCDRKPRRTRSCRSIRRVWGRAHSRCPTIKRNQHKYLLLVPA